MGFSLLGHWVEMAFCTGMVANRNYELWDYRDMCFHFQGQVCQQNSLTRVTVTRLATRA